MMGAGGAPMMGGMMSGGMAGGMPGGAGGGSMGGSGGSGGVGGAVSVKSTGVVGTLGDGSHGIFGEEYGAVRTDAEWVWVLDPIDGTTLTAKGMANAVAVLAVAPRGTTIRPDCVAVPPREVCTNVGRYGIAPM